MSRGFSANTGTGPDESSASKTAGSWRTPLVPGQVLSPSREKFAPPEKLPEHANPPPDQSLVKSELRTTEAAFARREPPFAFTKVLFTTVMPASA